MPISQSELENWIRQENVNKPSCHVDAPEYHAGGMLSKAYLDFNFTVNAPNKSPYSARHRFSEVEAVREKLKQKYMKYGIHVPATPSKGLLQDGANTNNTFAKERMRGLILFCDHIFSNPFLANDDIWIGFLGGQSTGDVGYNMLVSSLTYVEQPFKWSIVEKIGKVKEEFECIESSLKAQLSALRSVQSAERSLATAHATLHNGLAQCVSIETTTVKCLNGYPFDATESIVYPGELLVRHSVASYDNLNLATSVCGAAPDEVMSVVLIPAVEHELNQMAAFKEMLKIHDDMMLAHGTLIIKLEKEEMGQNSAKIADYKIRLSAAGEDRSNFYKGLIYYTLPMHARHRGHAFRAAYSSMAAVKLMEASQAHTASLEFFRAMQVHPDTAAAGANTVLLSLKLAKMNSEQMDLGPNKGKFVDGKFAKVPLLEGLFEAAISGNYGPLQSGAASAPPPPFGAAASDRFSDDEGDNTRDFSEQGEWQGSKGGNNSVGI